MIHNNSNIINGWTLHFDEVSNNVYKVELTDNYGRKTATTDHDLQRAVETCLSYSFDIERQRNNTLNKFTFDTIKYLLTNEKLLSYNYLDRDLGSWIIEKERKRVVLDGRNLLLTFQTKIETDTWIDDLYINLKDLTFKQIIELKDKLKNEN